MKVCITGGKKKQFSKNLANVFTKMMKMDLKNKTLQLS